MPQLHPKVIYELVNSLTNRKPVKVNENSYLFGLNEEDMNFNLKTYEEKIYSRNTNNNNNNYNSNKILDSNESNTFDNKSWIKPRKFVVHINQVNFSFYICF